MKSLIILVALVLAAVLCCGLVSASIADACDDLSAANEGVRDAASLPDFDDAKRQLHSMQERWEALEKKLELTCDHDDLSLVTTALQRAVILCDMRDKEKLLLECVQIDYAFDNISRKEILSLGNVI